MPVQYTIYSHMLPGFRIKIWLTRPPQPQGPSSLQSKHRVLIVPASSSIIPIWRMSSSISIPGPTHRGFRLPMAARGFGSSETASAMRPHGGGAKVERQLIL